MKKKTIAALSALLVVGVAAGALYAFESESIPFGTPAPAEQQDAAISQAADSAAQEALEALAATNAEQTKEIDRLRKEVERLSDKPAEETADDPPKAAVPATPEAIPVSAPQSSAPLPEPKAAAENPPSSPASVPKENAGTVFEGYPVTVTDSSTPAVRAAGIDWPITKYYFIAESGDYLGSISGRAMSAIIEKYQTAAGNAPGAGGEWEFWFAEEFNAYRGIGGNSIGNQPELDDLQGSSTSPSQTNANFDASDLASEAFALINQERVDAGLEEVEMDSTWMDLAEMRAEELPGKYDHVRPDGTRMSTEYKCAEIINRRANTAATAVSSWMDSGGHKDIILADKYNYAGIGCYQDNGTVYWCMLFSK